MEKAAATSGSAPASRMPGVAEVEVEQCHGHTLVVLASVDALELHGMLGAAIQGLQRESADRLAAKCWLEKELVAVQETNKGLQAIAAEAEEVRRGLVPVRDLTVAQSALSVAEKRVTDLEHELKEARAEASSAEGRAKAAVTSAAEERKLSDALVARLQDDLTSLQRFITDLCRPLIGRITDNVEEAQSYDARQCVATLVDSDALSATCLRAYLQEISPTEVIPSDLVEVWRYLEKAPSVDEFMTRSAFRRGAATALSLGLAHFPEDFDLDDVTRVYPSSTGSVEIAEVLKLRYRAVVYSDRVWAMGDLLPYQETVVAPRILS